MLKERLAGFPILRGDLRKPYGRLDSFDLAKKGAGAGELVMPPVLEQPRRFRRHQPVI